MKLKSDLVLRSIGDDHVIVDPGKGFVDMSKVYTLNETAAFLWNKIKSLDFSKEDMISLIIEEYEIDEDSILIVHRDIEDIISFFEDHDLLEKK